MSTEPIVVVDSLRYTYGAVVALAGVSFRVDKPGILAMLGPNGSGKSTLFKLLSGSVAMQTGRVAIVGADIQTRRREVLGNIGVVFQKPGLDTKLTALENIVCHGQLFGLRGRGLRERARELLSRFGVSERADRRVETLSGGMQRRVELAKCLIHSPRVLILDEPSTGLDPAARATLLEYLKDLRDRDGVTSLMTTHLMEDADAADWVAILDAGRLVAMDRPEALKSTIGGDMVTVHSRSAKDLAQRIAERFGSSPLVEGDVLCIERRRGHQFIPELIEAFPGQIDGVSVAKPTLGDVFRRLTGHRFEAEEAWEVAGRR